jgi:hypothetical protein
MKAAGARFSRGQLVGKSASLCYIFPSAESRARFLSSGDELGSEPANDDEQRDLRLEMFLFELALTVEKARFEKISASKRQQFY